MVRPPDKTTCPSVTCLYLGLRNQTNLVAVVVNIALLSLAKKDCVLLFVFVYFCTFIAVSLHSHAHAHAFL